MRPTYQYRTADETPPAIISILLGVALSHSAAYSQPASSVGVKLASIDAGQVFKEEAPQVQRANTALRAASSRCTGSPEDIANYAVVVAKEVQRQGNAATAVELLEGLDAVLVDFKTRQDCARVLASYSAVRKDGYTHSRAVVMQRALMKVIAESNRR
jgi:hypothetical protein